MPTVPAVVYAEWWRGRSVLCRAAGEALASVKGASLADAVVMASAALRGGGIVYTSDLGALQRLQLHFPTVRLLPV